jgi:DNA-binding NtrC family response regulator
MVRVFAVDDESYVLRALSADLHDESIELQTCADPRAALALLRHTEFDIVICDRHMPGISGLELLTYLRKRHPNSVRLMLNAQLDRKEMLESIQTAGIFGFIAKPWKLPDLKRALGEAIKHRRELLEISSPGLTKVDFGPNDTIVLDMDMTTFDLKIPQFPR